MALLAYSLVTLAELKAFMPSAGSNLDAELERAIERASQRIEDFLDRRLVYRAPGEADGNDNLKALTVLANGAPALTAQPSAAGRTLIFTIVDDDRSITAGTLTVEGTVVGGATRRETFALAGGSRALHTGNFYTGAVVLTVADLAGHAAADKFKVGSSEGYVEFHSPCEDTSELILLDWPVRHVAEVNEDLNLVHGSTTALVEGTTFTVRQRRRLTRISNLLDFPWLTGRRVVKTRYSGGYITSANVPAAIKNIALDLAAWIFKDAQAGRAGLTTVTDGTGSRTYTGPPMLTQAMKDALTGGGYLRPEIFETTGERDFDLEAA